MSVPVGASEVHEASGITAKSVTPSVQTVCLQHSEPTNFTFVAAEAAAVTFFSDVFERIIDVLRAEGFVTSPATSKSKKSTTSYWLSQVRKDVHWGDATYTLQLCTKFIKYKLAAYFAYLTGTELPPNKYEGDRPDNLVAGLPGRWLRMMRKAHWKDDNDLTVQVAIGELRGRSRIISIGHALKMSKRAMPRPDRSMALRSMMDTYKKLTTKDTAPKPFPSPNRLPLLEIEEETGVRFDGNEQEFYLSLFRWFVSHEVHGLDLGRQPYEKAHAPSRSATYVNTRSKLGFYGEVLSGRWMRHLEDFSHQIPDPKWLEVIDGNVERTPLLVAEIDTTIAHSRCLYTEIKCWDSYVEDCTFHVRLTVGGRSYDEANKFFNLPTRCDVEVQTMMMDDGYYKPCSIFEPVIEALKVRSISKGPGSVPFALKALQDRLIKHLGSTRRYLVGREDSDYEVSRSMPNQLNPGERILSVDYEDSTNNLYQIWSVVASETIFDVCHVGYRDAQMWGESLYGGAVACANVDWEAKGPQGIRNSTLLNDVDRITYDACCIPKDMVRGQLMGNIVSFPILCLANSYCLWLSYLCSRGYFLPPDYCPFAVNGDDGIVPVTERGRRFWYEMSAAMGFPPSVGKVYWSEHFFDINSRVYHMVPGWRGQASAVHAMLDDGIQVWQDGIGQIVHSHGQVVLRAERIPFNYIGLAFGNTRTGEMTALTALMGFERGLTVGALQSKMLGLCPWASRGHMMMLFYKHFLYRSELYPTIKGLPWYVPECLGGLGMTPVFEHRFSGSITAVSGRRIPSFLTITKDDLREMRNGFAVNAAGESDDLTLIRLGPSDIDMRLAHHVMVQMEEGELRLPSKPKLVPQSKKAANYMQPPRVLATFGFEHGEDDGVNDGPMSTQIAWGFIEHTGRLLEQDIHEKNERRKHRQTDEYEARIVRAWCHDVALWWRDVKTKARTRALTGPVYGPQILAHGLTRVDKTVSVDVATELSVDTALKSMLGVIRVFEGYTKEYTLRALNRALEQSVLDMQITRMLDLMSSLGLTRMRL